MLILPRLTDEFEIRGEMKRCNSFSPTPPSPPESPWIGWNNGHAWDTKAGVSKLSCLGHRPPPFNLHFIMVTSAVGPKALTPSLTTKAVSSNIWGYWHWKEPLSELWDCQLWDVSAGGGSCQPNQAAELLSWGLALLRHLVHGPSTQRALPHPPPLFGHRWEWEAEHIVEISGDPSLFALFWWLETVTLAKLVFPDWHQMVLTYNVASAVWGMCVYVGGWVLCVMDMLLQSYKMGRPYVSHYGQPVLSLGGSLAYAKQQQHRISQFLSTNNSQRINRRLCSRVSTEWGFTNWAFLAFLSLVLVLV